MTVDKQQPDSTNGDEGKRGRPDFNLKMQFHYLPLERKIIVHESMK